jgi:type II secretory pathway component PulF
MLSFLQNYLWIILLIAFIAMTVYNFYRKYKGRPLNEVLDGLRQEVYRLMELAEDKWFVDEAGYVKFNWVVQQIMSFIPNIPIIKKYFTEHTVAEFVQNCYYDIKDKFDNGKIDDSVPRPKV